ncbi:MAG TPA: PspA/IM30 family protein [Vicinamibacterales bacterium]|jgi:phage shock protein A|nr:PspA/IM30 family protein [Vicinamibacterales bacterium]
MGLLERVATLVRANLNDLIDQAEDPGKMIKQVILDMENQLLQLKTQVAVSIADQHMLEKRQKENAVKAVEWLRKAELAVDRGQDDLARAALERHKSAERTAASFEEQVADQRTQVAALKAALGRLEQKLAEANAKSDLLLAQHRRARTLGKASDAQLAIGSRSSVRTFDRMRDQVVRNEAVSEAKASMVVDDLDDRFARLERDDEVDRLLADLKAKRQKAGA